MALLEVNGLRVSFHTRDGVARAVDGLSFYLDPGETLGIVGESGSGKSVAMMSLLGLVPSPPGRIGGGTALFEGTDLLHCPGDVLRRIRGRRIGMVFQDPMTALNPFMTIGAQVMEPLLVHGGMSRREARDRAAEALDRVGLPDARRQLDAWPHAFSGGMRQRVMIAMALCTNPALLIADEPTTALDVTVQAQILDLVRGLQNDAAMGMILITHDLGVAAEACDRVVVMYAGRAMETAPVASLFSSPRHPYTRALLDALPAARDPGEGLRAIPGLPPDPRNLPPGCPFAPRCPRVTPACTAAPVALQEVAEGHASACLLEQG
jgi:oligopeptide transport system ATP-binding protein